MPFLVTGIVVVLAGLALWAMWGSYVAAPWTRDGRVRAYVVTVTPEVSGRIVDLPVKDNQFVHKGDLLVAIDPSDYAIAVENADAAAARANAAAENAQREAQRREQLSDLSTSLEERQTFASNAISASAQQRQAVAALAQARVNLERATIRSPVDGWVTNLQSQLGDYASPGHSVISLVDANSYWIDGYFEETALAALRPGDHAKVRLMGYNALIAGHVGSVARGITVSNATPGQSGLADVNPIFTWVRLAQRVPVRIEIDTVPDGVTLVAGQTATVQIDPSGPRR
ncbi:MAG: efflux RND transporter periplasmic adaptor subunit [Acetobacteraceae bacterium]|nr:efflux RND transporter periplasmic adaptor subunit [Acetobacteraceae bacterium]